MNDAELAILIRIQTEIASGKDPREILQGIKEEAKKVEEEGAKAGHAGGEGFEFMGLKGHEAHAALRLISGQLGEVGHLLHFIFSPELAGLVGFIIAMKMVNEEIATEAEQLEKVAEWQKKVKEIAEQAHDASVRASVSETAAYQLKLQHQFDGEDRLKKAIEERLKLYDSEQDHIKSLIDIEGGRFNAYIAYLVRIGKLTEEQGKQAEEQEKKRVEDAKHVTDTNKAKADIAAKESEANEQLGKKIDIGSQLNLARDDAKKSDEIARKNQGQISLAKEKLAELKKTQQEAQSAADKANIGYSKFENTSVLDVFKSGGLGDLLGGYASVIGSTFTGKTPDKLGADATTAKSQVEHQAGNIANLEDSQTKLEIAHNKAAKFVESLESQTTELTKSLHDLTDAISNARAELVQKGVEYSQKTLKEDVASTAAQYYRVSNPDEESKRLFELGRPPVPTNDKVQEMNNKRQRQEDVDKGLKDVLTEANNIRMAHLLGEDNESTIAATLQHIAAIIASNVAITENQQKMLLYQQDDLKKIDDKLLRMTSGNQPVQ